MATPTSASVTTIQQDYANILFRSGDLTNEINPWALALDGYNAGTNTAWSPAAIANSIAISYEAVNYVDPIVRLYQAAFNRAPDQGGLKAWVNAMQKGASFASVVTGFVASAEFATTYGSANPNATALLPLLYENVLNRLPDAVGLASWTNAMASGMSVTNVVLGFVNSTEFVNNSAPVITNWLTAFAASNSFVNSVAIGSHAVAQGYASTVALTTGIDTLAPTGNTLVTGVLDSVAANKDATFTALDSITASGTNNALNLSDVNAAGSGLPAGVTVSGVQNVTITGAGVVGATNVTGWTGLQNLTVKSIGGTATITAASTTSINETDSALAAGTITVNGGSNVSVTATGLTAKAGTQISVGTAAAAPAGNVNVTTTFSDGNATTQGAIAITGGTNVTVNESAANAVGTTNTLGAVSVTGTSATTSVTVTQTAAATAKAATAGSAATLQTGAVTAAPGVQGVTGVGASAAAVAASSGVAGVVDGNVTVQDANYNTAGTNTITSISLTNYGTATINDNALATLSVTGGGSITLTNATNGGGGAAVTANNTLTLNAGKVGASGAVAVFNDVNSEITTLNVNTTGADYLTLQSAGGNSAIKTLAVSGTGALNLTAGTGSVNALTSLTVSGSASFNDGGLLAARGAALTITDTSSGTFTAALDATTQTFKGSTGQDIITITADATKAITGGSATNNELILSGTAATFTAAKTGTNVTGFTTLGINDTGEGGAATFDLGNTLKGFTAIEVIGYTNAKSTTFANVASGTSLQIDAGDAAGAGTALVYQAADATGTSDILALTLGTAANKTGFTVTALTLNDANGVGIGTVNLTSNASTFNNAQTITTLTDNGLANLNVSGNGGLVITNLTESATQATQITINNTSTSMGITGGSATNASVQIGTLTDANLGALNFAGSGNTEIGNLSGVTGKILTISNLGTGTVTIGDGTAFADANLTSLTLNGNVALNANSATPAAASFATTGVTISGATDNAHVNINLTGAAASNTDTITLGNGNDVIADGSTAGAVKITVGSGGNLIDVHTGANNATYSASITMAAHTNTSTVFNEIIVSATGGQASGYSTTITGATTGDVLVFENNANTVTATAITAAQQNIITGDATLTAAIAHAFGDTAAAAHSAIAFQWQGDTYVVEDVAGNQTFTVGTDYIVKLAGLHTISTTAVAGIGGGVSLAS